MAADNKMLGEFYLDGIPPAPRGSPQIEVAFDIDANGIVTVSAKNQNTGREQHITIRSSGGLSEDEIQKMVRESELHAKIDEERKQVIELKNSADATVHSIEGHLREYKDKLPGEVVIEIESALSDLRNIKDNDKADDIKSKIETANRALSKIGQSMAGGPQGGVETPEAENKEARK